MTMLPFRRFPLSQALPSWWLAPWFLLLLVFCTSLFPETEPVIASGIEWPIHDGGLCLGGIQQLILPPLKQASGFSRLPYLSPDELEKARIWQTISFNGNGIKDFVSLDNVRQCMQNLHRSCQTEKGLRVRFSARASYSSLTEVLFSFWITDWEENDRYWLDVRHEPMTLYFVTQFPNPALD